MNQKTSSTPKQVPLSEALTWALIANGGGLLIGLWIGYHASQQTPPPSQAPTIIEAPRMEDLRAAEVILRGPCARAVIATLDLSAEDTDTVGEVANIVAKRCP